MYVYDWNVVVVHFTEIGRLETAGVGMETGEFSCGHTELVRHAEGDVK